MKQSFKLCKSLNNDLQYDNESSKKFIGAYMKEDIPKFMRIREKKKSTKVEKIFEKMVDNTKDSKDVKDNKDAKDNKDVKDVKDIKDIKDVKDNKDSKDVEDNKDNEDVKDNKDSKDIKATKESKASKDNNTNDKQPSNLYYFFITN